MLVNWIISHINEVIYMIVGALGLKLFRITKDAMRRIVIPIYTNIIEYIVSRVASRLSLVLASRWFVKRYAQLQMAKDDTRFLRVPFSKDIPLSTDAIFVPLTLEEVGLKKTFNHKTILNAGSRIQVIGDPGSGKTSIIKRIFRDHCRALLDGKKSARFPVIIELRKLPPAKKKHKALGEWLLKHIRDTVSSVNAYNIANALDIYIDTDGLLVLLDGLDEVPSDDFQVVSEAINQLSIILANKSEHNAIIMTMRTQFHSQIRREFIEQFPAVLGVRSFSPTDIFEFLNRWPFQSKHRQNANRIYAELTDRPTLREMCANPLVLAMYVARDQATLDSVAPESRTEFYNSVVEELIYFRRAGQTPKQKISAKLRDDWKRFLAQISLEHLKDSSQPANCLRWDHALATGTRIFSCDREEAEDIIHTIARYTGLITVERESESLHFIHLTFCEFFAAWGAVNLSDHEWDNLLSVYQRFNTPGAKSRLAEVIPFTLRHLPGFRHRAAMLQILALQDERLSALSFFESKQYEIPEWEQFADTLMDTLVTREPVTYDTEWLYSLHLTSVVMRDAIASLSGIHQNRLITQQQQFYERLVNRGDVSITRMIAIFAKIDAVAAFRLAQYCNINLLDDIPLFIVSNCDQPPFLAMVIDRIENDANNAARWAFLMAEAALRSPVVADNLFTINGLYEWRKLESTVHSKHKWNRPFKRSTALTQALPIGCSFYVNNAALKNTSFHSCGTLLAHFSTLRAPMTYAYRDFISVAKFLLFVVIIAYGIIELVSHNTMVGIAATVFGISGAIFQPLLLYIEDAFYTECIFGPAARNEVHPLVARFCATNLFIKITCGAAVRQRIGFISFRDSFLRSGNDRDIA
jgi:hypothetical protein